MNELGYIYGFTNRDIESLRPSALVSRLRRVKVEADREFEKMQIELASVPVKPPHEVRLVKIRGFHINRDSPVVLKQLQQQHPEYQEFLVVNQMTHNLIEAWDDFASVGSLEMRRLEELPSEKVSLDFFAFVQPTNRHLWALEAEYSR